MARTVSPDSPEYYATFTTAQLRTLADSTDPAHIVYGLMAASELILREALAASSSGNAGRYTRAAARAAAKGA